MEPASPTPESLKDALRQTIAAWRHAWRRRIIFLIIIYIVGYFWFAVFIPPRGNSSFPKVVSIPTGATVRDAASILLNEGVINSPLIFKDLVIIFAGEQGLQAGAYIFDVPVSSFTAARRFVNGKERLNEIRVTIPEGLDNRELAALLSSRLLNFDEAHFLSIAAPFEGYLFPDTYHFEPTVTPEVVIQRMRANFERKFASIKEQVELYGKPLEDVVIMASLLEEEARTTQTRRIIAGILWQRLSIGMLLQVDAVFPYIIGKNTFEVTLEDLATDSPYNTYTRKGLTPGPISNPGLDSILAAVTPIKTEYLFYLTDHNGVMRYARTYDMHLENVRLYLR